MSIRLFAAILLCAVPLGFAYGGDEQNVARLKSALLYIEVTYTEPTGHTTAESGTGFIVSSVGYALTAGHLIISPGAQVSAVVGGRFGAKLPATVIPGMSPGDAALIALPPSLAPYPIVPFADPLPLAQGQHLVALGFPGKSDLSVASGDLSVKGGPGGMWQVSIPLNYGNSGGPVIDGSGRVVGMVEGGIANQQEINFMIPINLLGPLLNAAGLIWPPYPIESSQNSVLVAPPASQPLVPQTTPQGGQTNCHDVVVVSAGLPPTYQRRLVCD